MCFGDFYMVTISLVRSLLVKYLYRALLQFKEIIVIYNQPRGIGNVF